MSDFLELARAKLGESSPPLPLRNGLDADPEGLGKRSTGSVVVRERYVNKHPPSLSMLATGVKGAVKLALRGTFYDPRVGTMGERMKALRLSRGLTLEDMGKVMEITAQALSQIENGITKNVRLDNFLRFCAHFDADPYFVVFGENKSAATGRFRKLKLP